MWPTEADRGQEKNKLVDMNMWMWFDGNDR